MEVALGTSADVDCFPSWHGKRETDRDLERHREMWRGTESHSEARTAERGAVAWKSADAGIALGISADVDSQVPRGVQIY